jgi:hypothetical protein
MWFLGMAPRDIFAGDLFRDFPWLISAEMPEEWLSAYLIVAAEKGDWAPIIEHAGWLPPWVFEEMIARMPLFGHGNAWEKRLASRLDLPVDIQSKIVQEGLLESIESLAMITRSHEIMRQIYDRFQDHNWEWIMTALARNPLADPQLLDRLGANYEDPGGLGMMHPGRDLAYNVARHTNTSNDTLKILENHFDSRVRWISEKQLFDRGL